MLAVQEAGADAIIIQDMAILEMARNGIGNIREDFRIPLHASTQCAIRTPECSVDTIPTVTRQFTALW